jgi:hypothetical protein
MDAVSYQVFFNKSRMQRRHKLRYRADDDTDPRSARVRLCKCEVRLQHVPELRQQIPQPGHCGEFVDSFELRFFLAQASVINEAWQVGCHRPRIIGLVTTPVKNDLHLIHF